MEKEEEKVQEDDIHTQTELMIKRIQEQMRLTQEVLNRGITRPNESDGFNPYKSMKLPSSKNENPPKQHQNLIKIEDSSLEFVNLEENYAKKPENALFDDCCSICSSKIYFRKYICVVCKDCILCPKCEIEHEHPVLKCKSPPLSTLESVYVFINTRNQLVKDFKNNTSSGFLSNIFSKYYELKLESNSYEFTIRPNKKIRIPISISNLSGTEFDCGSNKVVLFGRNNKDLKIYTVCINDKLNKSEQTETFITIESNDICKVYDFTIELFSLLSSKLKNNILNFKIEVNNDNEEESLNDFFKEYPKVIIESKKIKEGVKKIYLDSKNKYDPLIILQYLKNNNGNVDEAFFELSSKK